MRKAVKGVGWIVAGLAGLAAVACAAVVVTNWSDQPPSPAALRLAAIHDSRPAVADEDNGYIYLFGFDAPLDEDPRAVGAQRLAWLQSADNAPFARAADPQTTRLEYESTDPTAQQLVRLCGTDTRACAEAFADNDAAFASWMSSHPWLLERYRELIAYGGWREPVLGGTQPAPNFGAALRGHFLLMLEAERLADDNDIDAVRELLASDARFWRMVLASSDTLLTKMIATGALRSHFAWGNLVMRSLPEGRTDAIPAEWRAPMTDDELSLRRTLAGEHVFIGGSLRETMRAARSASLGTRVHALFFRATFQPQDTLNRQSVYWTAMIDTLDAPLLGFAQVADNASRLARAAAASPPLSLYNLSGVATFATPDMASYARRVKDLEGMRRAALALATLRAEQPPDFAAALAFSTLRNPYDDRPLRWDENDQAVVFAGLAPGERGEHRFHY